MWEQVYPTGLTESGALSFEVAPANKFIIEVPRPPNKETWDFAGWLYFSFQDTFLGEVEGTWKRIYLGKKQKIIFDNKEIDADYKLIFNPVHWLETFSISLWRWVQVDEIVEIEKQLSGNFEEVLPKNTNRKDFQIANLGSENIHYYWGSTGTWTVLPVGVILQGIDTDNFQSLSARASENRSVIKIIERSEM